MKAIVQRGYGPPDALQLTDIEKPVPKEGELLVKVEAAAANPLDWHGTRGRPFLVRFASGLFRPRDPRVGADFSGKVEAAGEETSFRPGDEVYGTCAGSFAEYAIAQGDRLEVKPSNTSFEEAAAIPVAATTALQGLRDSGHVKPGQMVLVNGASGGVGSFAVQIAKALGASVTGVCGSRNLDMVRSIGADEVVDYMKEDFTKNGRQYDLILDAVGNRSVTDYKRALAPQGTCVIVGFGGTSRMLGNMINGPLRSLGGSKKVGLMGVAKINHNDLAFLRGLVEAGKIRPVIDRRYPLAQAAQAIKYLEEGHARGKVIIYTAGPN